MRRAPYVRVEDDAVDSLFDVPAAVLCALCGRADCAGCGPSESSGVLAIVPWERDDGGAWKRLWATARATTQGADAFFAALPDGPVTPAVRFAVVAEMLAVAALIMAMTPLVALVVPGLALDLLQDAATRARALRWILLGTPAVALWMVAAHVSHGVALDLGARLNGTRSQRRRAVRAGLYACGWDLMTGPLGAVVTLFSGGWRALTELVSLSVRVPGMASMALLQGVYGLRAEAAQRARRAGTVAAITIAIVSAVAVLGLLVALLRLA